MTIEDKILEIIDSVGLSYGGLTKLINELSDRGYQMSLQDTGERRVADAIAFAKQRDGHVEFLLRRNRQIILEMQILKENPEQLKKLEG